MAKRIRFSPKKETFEDETRYSVKDHMGQTYVDHKTEIHSYASAYMTNEEYCEKWRTQTSLTPEAAMAAHAPLSWDGDVLPPETRITRITIETLSEAKRDYTFYVLRDGLPTFLVNPKEIKFYGFETLDGDEERFLYSDIKHICFKEV